jgi:hypothetical protein
MLDSYLIAVDNLTISSENRLRRRVEKLEVDKSLIDQMKLQIEQIQEQINADKSRSFLCRNFGKKVL